MGGVGTLFLSFYAMREVDEGEGRGTDLTAMRVQIDQLCADRPKVCAGRPAPIAGLFLKIISSKLFLIVARDEYVSSIQEI